MTTSAALACSIERARIGEACATDPELAEWLIGMYVAGVLVRLGVRA